MNAKVSNPPVVGAIGTHTGVDVVIAQSFDADALIVPETVRTPAQLAGKSVGVLVGSSEDYELRGWLALEHLTASVKVVGFASEQAAAVATWAGRCRSVRAGGAGSPADRQGRPGAAHDRLPADVPRARMTVLVFRGGR
jgi:hypothetical protein